VGALPSSPSAPGAKVAEGRPDRRRDRVDARCSMGVSVGFDARTASDARARRLFILRL
jgi:hypothetical protein